MWVPSISSLNCRCACPTASLTSVLGVSDGHRMGSPAKFTLRAFSPDMFQPSSHCSRWQPRPSRCQAKDTRVVLDVLLSLTLYILFARKPFWFNFQKHTLNTTTPGHQTATISVHVTIDSCFQLIFLPLPLAVAGRGQITSLLCSKPSNGSPSHPGNASLSRTPRPDMSGPIASLTSPPVTTLL